MYTFFEPELPSDTVGMPRTKLTDAFKIPGERRPPLKLQAAANKSGSKSSSHSHSSKARVPQVQPNGAEKKANNNHICGSGNWRRPSLPEKTSWNVLDLKGENYFSCSVGRTRTNARYVLASCDEVVAFLKELAEASSSSVSS